MAINLGASLRWKTADAEETAMLADLQGNILKGHGRHATRHIFLEFSRDQARSRKFIRDLSTLIVSAHEQLRQADAHKLTGISGGPLVAFFLSFEGYQALGAEALAPADEAFRLGMRARVDILADPPKAELDEDYQGALHAMVLIAGDPDDPDSWTSNVVDDVETKILNLLGGGGRVVAAEAGRAIFNAAGGGLEHFGYVDGRSQPLLLVEDIEKEEAVEGGIDHWDPTSTLEQVLVKDPGSPSDTGFGSYFVFRKLEQNVRKFDAIIEDGLGDELGIGDLAGAMIVGRWEDGTSVELFGSPGHVNPISNNFNYSGDPDGLRCPVHAHVRKTNPRGETGDPAEHRHLMARRGIPYGRRDSIVDPQDKPEGDVGLLFMAYQSDIARQFEFTQALWANNPDFVRPLVRPGPQTGLDPTIGQVQPPGTRPPLQLPKAWDNAGAGTLAKSLPAFVTMKGGEYFFAPAKSTLASL
ncbi:Dyp-type peroxidase [soil metagenome]